MNQPLIILSPQAMPMEAPFRQHYHYTNGFNMAAIRQAGGLPVMPSFTDEEGALALLSRADGLFLTGGEDVSPALYGEEPLPACGTVSPERDASDRALLGAALALHKPVFCVCRGCQLANAVLGGTLWQDVPSQRPSDTVHSLYKEYDRETAHRVSLFPDTPLRELLGVDTVEVNSLHHQAIRTLAPGLRPMAAAPDGIVEAWYLPTENWVWGVQWHPEMVPDSPVSRALFGAFLAACRQ